MFQIFNSTSVSNNIQQENNVTARKHETKNRKPLKEITGKLQKEINKTHIDKENDLKIDICSYKPVPDNFNDIMGPTDLNLRESLFKNYKTPTKSVKFDELELLDVDFNFNLDFLDDVFLDLKLPEL